LEIKKILILSQSALMLLPSLERSMEEFNGGFKVSFKSDFTFEEADLIFLDYSYLKNEEGKYKSALEYVPKLALLTALVDHNGINEILKETKVEHLFGLSGANSFSDIRDFIITFFNQQFWTADTFCKNPIKVSEMSFLSSEGIFESIQELLTGHDFSECFEGIEDYLTQVLNESILNAIFNAPVDDMGSHMFKRMNKKTIIHMIPGKEPVVKLLTDPKKIVISIKDFYGTLTKNDIFDYLPLGEIREKEGGAGIGMYLIFKFSHKFVINIQPRKFTEMIFVIDKDKRFKWYSSKEKSFHLFMPN
jgi:hypothetical protein